MISYSPPFDLGPFRQNRQYVCKSYSGKNIIEMSGIDDWQQIWHDLFHKLFRPSAKVLEALDAEQLPEQYAAVNVRFINSLGHREAASVNAPYPEETKKLIIGKALEKAAAIAETEKGKIIIYSDSPRFLEAARESGYRTCDPAKVGNIMESDDRTIVLYTFVYQLAMAKATRIYSLLNVEGIPGDALYKSQFPRYAAIIGGKPFIRI